MHTRTTAALECGHLALHVQPSNCYFQQAIQEEKVLGGEGHGHGSAKDIFDKRPLLSLNFGGYGASIRKRYSGIRKFLITSTIPISLSHPKSFLG